MLRKFVLVFVIFLCFVNSTLAAPGDTISVVSSANVTLHTSTPAAMNGPAVITASITNTNTNAVMSNINLVQWGSFYTSVSKSGTLTGTVNCWIKKNGLNGNVLWQTSVTNPWINSGSMSISMPSSLPNLLLYPGESLNLVISHTLQPLSGYTPSVYAVRNYSPQWSYSYWLTDYLVQRGVDNAAAAKVSADSAKISADTAANRSLYTGTYGGNSESVADLAGYIRNTQLPGIDTKITNLQTAVTNINNSIGNDTTAPVIKVKTVSGARATSAGSINVVLSGADNKDPFTALQYSVNGGAYAPMPANGIINIPVNISPITTTTIAVKDSAGNIATELISIRKL